MAVEEQQKFGIAALWMLGTIVSFTIMAIAGRELSANHDTFEIMFYRSLVGLAVVSLALSLLKRWSEVTTRSMGTQITRNLAHFMGQNLWFYAVTAAPLAQVFALEFTTPLWVVVLSPLVLGEKLTPVRALAALIGFVGILVVARPGAEPIGAGVITATVSAIFFATTIMLTKRLTRTETIACILFWLTATQLVMGLVAAGYDGDLALPTSRTWPWLVLVGLAGLVAHFCMANALAIAPATVVVPFDFARLPAIAVVGMLLYGEPLDLWVFLGAALIFVANYINIMSQTRRNRVA